MNTSNEPTPPNTTPPLTSPESSSASPPSTPSEPQAPSTDVNEAPLLSLNPVVKPLVEMTDEELQTWHSRHRSAIFTFATLKAEARERSAAKKDAPAPKLSGIEYE